MLRNAYAFTRRNQDRTGITEFVDNTMDLKGALDQNPIPFYKKEVNAVLDQLLEK